MTKINQFKIAIKRIGMVVRLIQKTRKSFFPFLILSGIMQSAQVVLAVFIPKLFIDALTQNLKWSQAIPLILVIAGIEGLLKLGQNLAKKKISVLQNQVQHEVLQRISAKITRLPYQDLENSEILDLKDSAKFAVENQNLGVYMIIHLQEMLRYGFTIVSLTTILLQLSWYILLFLLISFVAIALLQNSMKTYETNFYQNIIPVNRKYSYFVQNAWNAEIQQPSRIFNLEPMLITKIGELNHNICDWLGEYTIKSGKIQAIQNIINDLQAVVVYGYTALRVLSSVVGPSISIGSFSLYAGSTIQFSTAIREFFNNYREIKQIVDFLEPYQKFMELPEITTSMATTISQTTTPVADITQVTNIEASTINASDRKIIAQNLIHNIVFENVTFTYPNTDQSVLENVSFTIEQGEKISIVGLNGAGKTTLVKLICRFFEPDSGKILVNGQDIKTLDEAEYLKEIAAVFQDFKLLPFSIQSNIASLPDSEIDFWPDDPDVKTLNTSTIQNKIQQIAEVSGVDEFVKTLDQGLRTKLNKSINKDGTELSGGQSQKVAIARALFKQSSLVILDEPTSALDPLAEAEIYEHFDALVQGQTSLYISHRMSSSRFCDKVLVLDAGKVTGFAPHDELIQDKNSLYTKLFNEQAKYYDLNNSTFPLGT